MAAGNGRDIIFSATLTPYRSLTRRGFAFILLGIALLWFLTGLFFYTLGAWPVLGFFGFDLLLLWLAFHLNFRAARAYEEVLLTQDTLVIRQVRPSGRAREIRFNPYWVRLNVERIEDEGVTRIEVRMREQAVEVGAFLNPEDRESFAGAFGAALAVARKG
jgi:uncharacterized membrane protein